jgi:hypothetical protein
MDRRIVMMLAGTLMLMGQQPSSKACELAHITIQPEKAENGEMYSGQSNGVRVSFHNYRTTGAVTAFPEPPMVITTLKSGAHCDVDGGIWSRNGVYVSSDGKVLVTDEYSGSYDGLVFRDVNTCKKINELDVSEAHWSIQGSQVAWQTASGSKKTVSLDAQCKPQSSAPTRS